MTENNEAAKTGRRKVRDEVPLCDVVFTHWQNLFPEEKANAEATLRRWVMKGLIAPPVETPNELLQEGQSPREQTDRMFDKAEAPIDDDSEWGGLQVDITNRRLVVRLPHVPGFRPVKRNWFMPRGQMPTDPSWPTRNPIRLLAATPGWEGGQLAVHHLIYFVCVLIDCHVLGRICEAIRHGRLQIRAREAGEFGAGIVTIPVARFMHPFSLDIRHNRISFEKKMPVFEKVTIAVAKRQSSAELTTKSYAADDDILVEEMHARLCQAPSTTLDFVSGEFAKRAKGRGNLETKAKRLRDRFRKKYPNWSKELSKKEERDAQLLNRALLRPF